MKIFSFKLLLNGVFLLMLVVGMSCGSKTKRTDPTPAPEVARITKLTLTLDGPKAKLDAVANHQDGAGISNPTSTKGITLSAATEYAGVLVLEETKGTTTTVATAGYSIAYQITGVDATISPAGDKPTLTTRGTGTGTLKVTVTKGTATSSVTFPLTVTN